MLDEASASEGRARFALPLPFAVFAVSEAPAPPFELVPDPAPALPPLALLVVAGADEDPAAPRTIGV